MVPSPETEAQERPAHEGGDDAHLRAMLDGVRIGTWQMELPQEALRLSQMSASLLGLPEASLATFGELLALVHEEDRGRVAAELERSATQGHAFDCDYRILLPGGEVHWLRQQGRRYRDGGGALF